MNSLLKGVNLYLVAMPGSGKSAVGCKLAPMLGYRFFDTDEVIIDTYKKIKRLVEPKPIAEIFAEEGEEAFRYLESQVLANLCAYTNSVVATGGGIVVRRKNWSYLHHGLVVWLDVPVEIIYTRLASDTTRPLLEGVDLLVRLQTLFEVRQPLYAQADLRVTVESVEETPEQIAKRIIEESPTVLK